jgi:tetratricopeptide (TPR) repeat protein
MLQVVRELAAERLADSGEDGEMWRRASRRLAAMAADAAPVLVTTHQAEVLDRIQAEHDNLRAALAWATEHDPMLAAEIAAPVWRYWQMRGYLREGRAVLAAIRDRLPADEGRCCYAVLTALGGIAYWQRDLTAGEEAYSHAVRLAEENGDAPELAEALYNLSFAVWQQGRLEEAAGLAERSGRLYADLGDSAGLGRLLWLRGVLAMLTGDLRGAEELLRESVERQRGGSDAFHLGWSLRMLGRTLLLQGRAAEARRLLEESLRLFAPSGDVSAVVLHLADFATLAVLEDDVEREFRLVGAMRRLKEVTGTELVDHPVNEVPGFEETRGRLGAEGEDLLAEGAAMTDDEVIAYALREEPAAP